MLKNVLLQRKVKAYKIIDIFWKKVEKMNFNDKRTRRIIAIVVMVIIAAMVATTILPVLG